MVKVDIGRPPILGWSAVFHARKMIVNLTIAVITGFVGTHGVAALAGTVPVRGSSSFWCRCLRRTSSRSG
jgi:hypothetical protein